MQALETICAPYLAPSLWAARTEVGRASHRLAAAVLQRQDPRRLAEALAFGREQMRVALQLEQGLASALRPATDRDIERALQLLLLAYPNAPRDIDLAGYGRLLAEDVSGLSPSSWSVELGCAKLRRTSRFLPSIADVLAAITEMEGLGARVHREAKELGGWIERAVALLDHPRPARRSG